MNTPPCPIELTKKLIEMPSITPEDGGTLTLISELLAPQGFIIERLDQENTKNLFAHYGESSKPLFIFLGHVDVVPPGPEDAWKFSPFSATEHEGYLYGRGAADMKSGVAAMVCALTRFVKHQDLLPFRIGLLLTSDEEGKALHGIKHVMQVFQTRQGKITYCIVGEPSSKKILGDTIKIGRRGSLSGTLTILGKQGHIAYPELAENPIHRFAATLTKLTTIQFDQGNAYFQPTSLQFSNIHAGVGANNVIPSSLEAEFNLRYSPETSADAIMTQIEKILDDAQLNYHIDWHLGGLPFLTNQGLLLEATIQATQNVTDLIPELSTHGGTSDGRFVAPTGSEVVEIGLCNKTIHQINECVRIADITQLADIYYEILKQLLNSYKEN